MSSCCLAINDCRHNNESSKGSSSMTYLYCGKNSDFDTKDPSLHQFSGLVSFHHDHILSPYLCLNVSDIVGNSSNTVFDKKACENPLTSA